MQKTRNDMSTIYVHINRGANSLNRMFAKVLPRQYKYNEKSTSYLYKGTFLRHPDDAVVVSDAALLVTETEASLVLLAHPCREERSLMFGSTFYRHYRTSTIFFLSSSSSSFSISS